MKLGSITLEEEIGRGAFSAVYKAKHEDGSLLAVKCPLSQSEESQEADQRELEAARALSNHQNIVTIKKFIRKASTKQLFYVLELCEAGDLNDYIINNNPQMAEKFPYMVDIARGVNYLHSAKVIHRDLKPQNVLLAQGDGRLICKITDFGIAKSQVTVSKYLSTVAGTPIFRAPEITDMLRYTFSVDVYSLGLVYFVMYTTPVLREGKNKYLFPMTEHEGQQMPLPTVIRRAMLSENSFLDRHFRSCRGFGKMVHAMIQYDPKRRPLMDEVIALVAEAKGTFMASQGSNKTTAAPQTARPAPDAPPAPVPPSAATGRPSTDPPRSASRQSPSAASLLLQLMEHMAGLGFTGRGSFREDADSSGKINVNLYLDIKFNTNFTI